MTSILNYKLDFNRKLRFNFEGGSITTDAGLILIKEFDNKIGFSKMVKENLNIEEDCNSSRIHKSYELVIQKIYQCIAGYDTDQNCNDLRNDVMFTKILNKDFLASQSTMSRFINKVKDENVKQMENINLLLIDKVDSIEMPDYKILDLDSTNLSTYGHQEGSKFNYHYKAVGYHPLVMFDGMTNDLLKIELRNGNCYTSANKECKNGFNFESMSHSSFVANSFKLQVLSLAYNLVNVFKRLCLNGKFKKFTIETLRGKLIKIAAKIIKSSRNQIFKICSNFPYKTVFLNTLEKIQALLI